MTQVRARMGTWLGVTIATRRGDGYPGRHMQAAFDVAARCERLMSRHDADSALSRVNRAAGARARVEAPELARILRRASALARMLSGAFDPTVGPFLDLWHRAASAGRRPSARSLDEARSRAGLRALRIAGPRVGLTRPGAALDLDGFGKGLALDRIALALRRRRSGPAFLNFGESSLMAVGGACAARWPVLLRHPLGGLAGGFSLRDRACSTSSTVGRPLRVGGRVVGDIVDPRTGQPVSRRAQVTVIADSAADAEALSTALLVLGADAMEGIARRMRAQACWIDHRGIRATPGFELERPAS